MHGKLSRYLKYVNLLLLIFSTCLASFLIALISAASSARLKSLESFRSDFSRAEEAAEIQAGFIEIVIALIKLHVYKLACLVDKRSCLIVIVFCFHRGPRLLTVYTN